VSVVEAVERELDELDVADLTLAASAKALAAKLDDYETTAAAAASCARELRETMTQLRALSEARPRETDHLSLIVKGREKRRKSA